MIYTLKNSSLTVGISSHGAELRSIIHNSREYLWQRNSKYWEDSAPVLFPVVGRCLNDQIEIDGKSYPMEAHGFAQRQEFELIEQSDNFLTLCLTSNETIKATYPYDFKFYVTYSLSGSSITQKFRVENTGDKPLYYTIGGHPGFCCGDSDNFEDWELVLANDNELYTTLVTADCYISKDTAKIEATNGHISLKRDLFIGDALIFEETKSNKITLQHKQSGIGVTMDYSEFPVIAAWTLPEKGADFVCLEPWCGMGHIEGESQELSMRFGMMSVSPGMDSIKKLTIEIF